MIDAIPIPALALALYGAWRRNRGATKDNRAAWALAASVGLTSILRLAGAPFDMGLWIAIDIGVIAAIESGRPGATDKAIIALMPLCWPLYQLHMNDNPLAGPAVAIIVSLQLLLSVPWDRLGHALWTEKAA